MKTSVVKHLFEKKKYLSMVFQYKTVVGKQVSSSASESSQSRDVSPLEATLEDMQSRIKRLEWLNTINTVTMSHFVVTFYACIYYYFFTLNFMLILIAVFVGVEKCRE